MREIRSSLGSNRIVEKDWLNYFDIRSLAAAVVVVVVDLEISADSAEGSLQSAVVVVADLTVRNKQLMMTALDEVVA